MAIVKMKRVMFMTLAPEGEALMRLVQRLGVLHVEHIAGAAEAPEIEKIEHRLNMQADVIRELEAFEAPETPAGQGAAAPAFDDLRQTLDRLKSLSEALAATEREIASAEPWGEFDPKTTAAMADDGIFVQLWSAPPEVLRRIESGGEASVEVLCRGGRPRFATVSYGGRIEIESAEEARLPEAPLSELVNRREEIERERSGVVAALTRSAACLPELREQNESQRRERDFMVASERAFRDESVMAFGGWVPEPELATVRRAAFDFEAPVVTEARGPLSGESPPVLTRNGPLARTFEPLLHLLGMPAYDGLDPALYFAPFMMLFFGICLGDVGYGAAMMAAAYIMKRVLRKRFAQIGPIANMTMLFGAATAAWGLATGSVFGAWPASRELIPIDISYDKGDPMLLFRISIALAIVHLTLAFIFAARAAHTVRERLLKAGSIGIMIGGIMMVLKVSIWWAVFSAGIAAILLLSSDSRNPLKRLGAGLWNLYNHVGLLGDVMSYSRLFGLGIATGAIASVVNTLALDAREAVPGIGIVLWVLVLVAGHMFNITMGIISALVHPARLHAVEALPKFVSLTGEPYRPLAAERRA